MQRWLIVPDGGPAIGPDCMWPEQRLMIQTDGEPWHNTRRPHEVRHLLKKLWNH